LKKLLRHRRLKSSKLRRNHRIITISCWAPKRISKFCTTNKGYFQMNWLQSRWNYRKAKGKNSIKKENCYNWGLYPTSFRASRSRTELRLKQMSEQSLKEISCWRLCWSCKTIMSGRNLTMMS